MPTPPESSLPVSAADALYRLTPSATTRRASTSRPESVSSRIAIRGLSRVSCRISCRFFSPPEKPSFTERSAKSGSISRSFIAVLTSLTHLRIGGASPRTAVAEVRRKFEVDTPGTSTGYCMARNRPARARWSTVMASRSSPSRVTEPWATPYFGWPASEYASVDFPEPLGPMIACVSFDEMVRSTPRRISIGPSSVLTDTCRSRMSRVAMCVLTPICLTKNVGRHCNCSDSGDFQLALDDFGGPLANRRNADAQQHLTEEAAHHQSLGHLLRNAP